MKIHVVQKGDTLWELSKKYGVNFEELKQANTQLSSPDMIMPGMKIKIPGTAKSVKKEVQTPLQKKEQVHPYKEMSPQPKPVIKEDDHKEKMKVTPQMPQMPQMPPPMPLPEMTSMQMPIMEQEMTNYTTINVPAPPPPQPEKKKEKMVQQPPKHEPKKEQMPQPMPMPHAQPMAPMCCYVLYPCCPPHHMQWPQPMPMPMPQPVMPHTFQGFGQEPMMEMPVKPGGPMMHDCGCRQSSGPMPSYHQENVGQDYPAKEMNYYPPNNLQFGEENYPNPPSYRSFTEDEKESNE